MNKIYVPNVIHLMPIPIDFCGYALNVLMSGYLIRLLIHLRKLHLDSSMPMALRYRMEILSPLSKTLRPGKTQ